MSHIIKKIVTDNIVRITENLLPFLENIEI